MAETTHDGAGYETRTVMFTLTSRVHDSDGVPFTPAELRSFQSMLEESSTLQLGWSFDVGPVEIVDPVERKYRTADGDEIHVGDILYDNNLDVVLITELAHYIEHNYNTRENVAWHRHRTLVRWNGSEPGRIDTSDGSRLATRHPSTRETASAHAKRVLGKVPST